MKTIAFYTMFAIMLVSLCIESFVTFGLAMLMVFFMYLMIRGKSESEIKSLMGNDYLKKLGDKSKLMKTLVKEEEDTVC